MGLEFPIRQLQVCPVLHYKGQNIQGRCKPLAKIEKGTHRWFQERGHLVDLIQSTTSQLVFCNLCGCYQSGRAVGLNNDCKKEASKQKPRWEYLFEGKHTVHLHFMGMPEAVPSYVDEVETHLPIRFLENFTGAPRDIDLFGDWDLDLFPEESEMGMTLQEQLGLHGSFDS
jgi:hypothetical protein